MEIENHQDISGFGQNEKQIIENYVEEDGEDEEDGPDEPRQGIFPQN